MQTNPITPWIPRRFLYLLWQATSQVEYEAVARHCPYQVHCTLLDKSDATEACLDLMRAPQGRITGGLQWILVDVNKRERGTRTVYPFFTPCPALVGPDAGPAGMVMFGGLHES